MLFLVICMECSPGSGCTAFPDLRTRKVTLKMRATVMYGPGDVRIETVPDAGLVDATDAVVRVTHAAICGSDLWPYKSMEPSESGRRMGHEFIGVVEAAGSDVRTMKAG